ncbi:MAG TPA: transketolase [Pseudonocardiaceae bacterium]|nr:transketolase [Pseudonocardiaceae bacterium]
MTATTARPLVELAHRIRHHIVELATNSPGAHVGGSMSATEILTVLFFDDVLKVDPSNPQWTERDHLIYSKGHASAALYAVLAERGFFPVSELATYKQPGSRLAGHPSRDIPGVEWATGSLGHGLPVGVGISLANRHDNNTSRTFVVLGDGECEEGSVWEAAMSAAHFQLDNLVVVVDRNGFQEDGPTEEIMALEPFADKWRAFGWQVADVDGHDVTQLSEALHRVPFASGRPSCVIARTEKGHGLSFTANTHTWHYGKFSQEQYQQALAELSGEVPS